MTRDKKMEKKFVLKDGFEVKQFSKFAIIVKI